MNGTQHTTSIYPPPHYINQSDVANSTESQGNVTPLPQDLLLVKTFKGWAGRSEHIRVLQSVIGIKNTDADIDHKPSEVQRDLTLDEDGIFSQYEEIPKGHSIYQWWTERIAPYLAQWVLGKDPNENPPWKLLKFPDNYTLWKHKKGVDTDPANPRIDVYLYGAPHLGPSTSRSYHQLAPTIFRSPMEFVEHAIWLMKGREGQCKCKYCTPGQSQREINLRLHRGVAHDSDPESDDDEGAGRVGGGAGARNTNYASSSSSRRGAAAGARRARRGRRDRSPPVMFKDYRVGNPDQAS